MFHFDIHPPFAKLLYLGAGQALGYSHTQCSYCVGERAGKEWSDLERDCEVALTGN